jgi:hypothetical protein
MEKVKSLLKSKTVLLAILQAVVMVLVAVQTEMPELAGVGVAKSVIDVVVRLITTEPIKIK